VTIPGCVEAWGRLYERFGRLPFPDLLADAITYAQDGFPVSAEVAQAITRSASFFHPDTPARETFLPGGKPPVEGQMLRQPRLARTLRAIADGGADAYYRGEIAQELVRSFRAVGGLISLDDLAGHHSDWVEPLSMPYRDVVVYELPPNSQGIIALLMLGMLRHVPAEPLAEGGGEYVHYLAEAARLAYADRARYLTDIDHMTVRPEALLDDRYVAERAEQLKGRTLGPAPAGTPGDTIYLCTADGDGNLVSLIESNYQGIGSGVMAGETGVMLHNRGAWFSLDRSHANVIAPGKRTMHTLMPAMAFRDGSPWLVFGTMGGSAQAQIHVELLTRILDQGKQIDEALAAPRFDAVVGEGPQGRPLIQMEAGFPADVMAELQRRGHEIQLLPPGGGIGHAHAIQILGNGAYMGASDPRTTSLALGY
jgi:gamma-glutamyltranspeptidase/glutathione hydrolase